MEVQILLSIAAGSLLLLLLSRWRRREASRVQLLPVSQQWLSEQKRNLET